MRTFVTSCRGLRQRCAAPVLLKDYRPSRDSFVAAKLRKAGAIILGKNTLGELGGSDSYGSLFGATRNPYSLERTVGRSSGGTGASVAASFATIGVGFARNAKDAPYRNHAEIYTPENIKKVAPTKKLEQSEQRARSTSEARWSPSQPGNEVLRAI